MPRKRRTRVQVRLLCLLPLPPPVWFAKDGQRFFSLRQVARRATAASPAACPMAAWQVCLFSPPMIAWLAFNYCATDVPVWRLYFFCTGGALVAVNPMKQIDLYSPALVDAYYSAQDLRGNAISLFIRQGQTVLRSPVPPR